MAKHRRALVYVTASQYKQEENMEFMRSCHLDDGTPVSDIASFEFAEKPVLQILEVDIAKMVEAGVIKAYTQIRVPCIVEYAGVIFEKYRADFYPGGLTKAMWNALGNGFLTETHSAGERAVARAVIGFCDGKSVYTFVGETEGTLANAPRGDREFYWDTVFMPDDNGRTGTQTYSEIVADPTKGLPYKMERLSQSGKAMRKLLEFLRKQGPVGLWR